MNNALALTLKSTRLVQDLEGGLGAEPRHPPRQPQLMLRSLFHDRKLLTTANRKLYASTQQPIRWTRWCGAATLAREPREPAAAYVPEEFGFYGMREFTSL